jgi:hypothetical protein
MAKMRKKALAIGEYEVLENGVIICRDEIDKYEVWAGFGKTFEDCEGGCHSFYESTIAVARSYITEHPTDCESGCENGGADGETLSPYLPKGEAVKAREEEKRLIRAGIIQEFHTKF